MFSENVKVKSTYVMTQESIEAFIENERNNGTSKKMIRRYFHAVTLVYEYLPADKILSKELLNMWRKQMDEKGYSPVTVLNNVKYINKYLDFSGYSEIRFNKGKAKDIAGKTFGYLTAIEPTGKKNRGDIVWKCQCKCGNFVELPATRLLLGNTLSCGCLCKEHLDRVNMYIDNTSLRQSLKDNTRNSRNVSGYTGVVPKRNKWQAYINYKGKRYSLGCYEDIEDAVSARTKAKNIIKIDAENLLRFYEEMHKNDIKILRRNAKVEVDI